jgi:hypothetical protein
MHQPRSFRPAGQPNVDILSIIAEGLNCLRSQINRQSNRQLANLPSCDFRLCFRCYICILPNSSYLNERSARRIALMLYSVAFISAAKLWCALTKSRMQLENPRSEFRCRTLHGLEYSPFFPLIMLPSRVFS